MQIDARRGRLVRQEQYTYASKKQARQFIKLGRSI